MHAILNNVRNNVVHLLAKQRRDGRNEEVILKKYGLIIDRKLVCIRGMTEFRFIH